MSDEPVRICLIGATGLIGRAVIAASLGREDIRLSAIARREMALPQGARMELFVAESDRWGEVLEALRPHVVICALGTTWKKAGKDEAAFREVDQHLVLSVAQEAKKHAIKRFIHISSVGADTASGQFYLRVKGEVERDLAKLRFDRLDILRPGLLRGSRSGDRRPAERMGILVAPLINLLLHGGLRKYRGIRATTVAEAALALAKRPVRGRFVHDNDAIARAARTLPPLAVDGEG